MTRWHLLLPGLIFFACCCPPAQAQVKTRQEPLVDEVKSSIARGVDYLRSIQRDDGNWEVTLTTIQHRGGGTAIVLLALLNAGVSPDDPAIKNGMKFLRGLEPDKTYVRALQTLVFAELGRNEDRERIQANVNWLLEARVYDGTTLQGWFYDNKKTNSQADNSNTQYALLGLWAGKQMGAKIDPKVWEEIREFYKRTQLKDGSWWYTERFTDSPLTMTTAGLCGLLIAGLELNTGREILQPDGTATNCGVYEENQAANKALGWIGNRLKYQLPRQTFYNLYGIERVGRLSGLRFLGEHDWYREGCQFLVREQANDGSWSARGAWDQWPTISTSWALLFLSKGRTPVLISKLVHTERWPRPESDTDWNNDRNDLRHLVDFASKELFKKQPLAWQNFDMMRAATTAKLTDENLLDVTSDLLQSPIVYFNGHKSPLNRFRKQEKELLKKYIENGGFVLVEACCNSPEFDKGFKALAEELWPKMLEDLKPDHPIWTAFYPVPPGKPYQLMGISMGCKTVLVYSPQDLSCQWEAKEPKSARGTTAFRLGANIIAYVTGLEPPRPRLTRVELAGGKEDPASIPRGYFKVAQLQHAGNWKPAPRAMRNLMEHLHKHAGLDVVLKTEELQVASKNVIDFKFLYMHGREEFAIPTDQLKNLRFNLESGGLLFADACCGKPAFDKAFRKFMTELFPKEKLQEVPFDDDLFSKELNGIRLDEQTIQCRREARGPMRGAPPALEGIKIDNRWVVLYSKYDIGCALERHSSSDCLGYDPDSAFKIASAAVLYLLRPR